MRHIEKRWKEHIKDSKRERCEIRPLYRAMRKYGKENFTIEQIEECDADILSEREQYWIRYYDTYKDGYNATLGGEGDTLLDYDNIITTYLKMHNASQVARTFGCSKDSVYAILKLNDISIVSSADISKSKYSRSIIQYTKNGDFIKEYPSSMEAARNLGNLNYNPNIVRCANEKRKTANGYIWRWKDLQKKNIKKT